MRAPEVGDARLSLEDRHVQVEVHPVDALDLQGGVLVENLGHAACYSHPRGLRRNKPRVATSTDWRRGHQLFNQRVANCFVLAVEP